MSLNFLGFSLLIIIPPLLHIHIIASWGVRYHIIIPNHDNNRAVVFRLTRFAKALKKLPFYQGVLDIELTSQVTRFHRAAGPQANYTYRLCGQVVRVPGYRSWGPGFDSRRYQIFWEVVVLERGPPSLVRITEELLEWKSSGSGLGNRN
jgi:hypothetical protein